MDSAKLNKRWKERLTMVRQRYHLNPSRDVDNKRILEFDLTKSTSGQTKQRGVVLDATFLWWLSQWKKSKILISCFCCY